MKYWQLMPLQTTGTLSFVRVTCTSVALSYNECEMKFTLHVYDLTFISRRWRRRMKLEARKVAKPGTAVFWELLQSCVWHHRLFLRRPGDNLLKEIKLQHVCGCKNVHCQHLFCQLGWVFYAPNKTGCTKSRIFKDESSLWPPEESRIHT